MNDTQRHIAASLAFGMLFGVAAFLVVLTTATFQGQISGKHGLGWFYLSVIRDLEGLRAIFGSISVVIGAGISILGSYASNKWLVYLNCTIASVGIGCCFILYFMVQDAEGLARPLWYFSDPPMHPDDLVTSTTKFVGALVVWLGSFLATQLGLPKQAQASIREKVLDFVRPSQRKVKGR